MPGHAPLVPIPRPAEPPADAAWLRGRADYIKSLAYRSVCDQVRIGEALAEVAGRLRKARLFRRFVEAELPFSRGHAYKLIRVAAAFGPYVRPDAPEVIAVEALVILSAAPPAAVEAALEQARAGRPVTTRGARKLVADHHQRVASAHEAARAYDAGVDRELEEERVRAEERMAMLARAARAWDAMQRLVALGGPVTVATVDDEPGDAAPPSVHVLALLPGGRREAVRRSLGEAVAAVMGEEEERYCPGCDAMKPLAAFGTNESKAGGKNSRCRPCELRRVRDLKREQRAAARAGRAAVTAPA